MANTHGWNIKSYRSALIEEITMHETVKLSEMILYVIEAMADMRKDLNQAWGPHLSLLNTTSTLVQHLPGQWITASPLAHIGYRPQETMMTLFYTANRTLYMRYPSQLSRAKHGERILYGLNGINEGNDIVIVIALTKLISYVIAICVCNGSTSMLIVGRRGN
ncbi:hypothetical protein Tco_1453849 [Tanacetum coccineum]